MPEIDERRLVERMRAGDESAFDAFAERWVPGLYRFALRAAKSMGYFDNQLI
jgi:hypothetical protein